MEEQDYPNQELLRILKQFSEDEEVEFNYCKLYELLEGLTL